VRMRTCFSGKTGTSCSSPLVPVACFKAMDGHGFGDLPGAIGGCVRLGFEDMQRHIPETSKSKALIDWRRTRTLDEVVEDVIESQRAPQALAESA
jgi:hypothetical protein